MTQLANTSSTHTHTLTHTHTHTHTHTLWYFESYNESPFPRLLSEYLCTILSFYGGLLSSQETWRHKSLHRVSQRVGGWVPVCWWHHLREVQRALRDDAGGSKAVGNYLPFYMGIAVIMNVVRWSCTQPKDERACGATVNMLCASEIFAVLRYYAARLVICCLRLGTTFLKVKQPESSGMLRSVVSQSKKIWTARPLKKAPNRCSETSVVISLRCVTTQKREGII